MFDVQRDYLEARRLDLATAAARFEALVAVDVQAAIDAFRLARRRGDLAGMLAGGEALFDIAPLVGDEAAAYAAALMSERRFNEAVVVWKRVAEARSDAAGVYYHWAECLAAGGDMRGARRLARRAFTVNPDMLKAKVLAQRAKAAAVLRGEPKTWANLRLLVELQILLEAADGARKDIVSVVTAPPPDEPTDFDALRLVEAGLRLGRPKAVKRLYRQVASRPDPDDAVKTVIIDMASQLGAAPDAARRARDFLPPLASDKDLSIEAVAPRRRLRLHAASALRDAGRLNDAIRQLGALVTGDRRGFTSLTALQRCTGEAVLRDIGGLQWAEPRPPKIINLLPFYNESTLLEMRLDEMGDWVDHFVIVEATTTFTGAPKPLNFAAVREGLGRGDQLIGVALEGLPDFCDTAWARDFYQRDMAVRGLNGLVRPDDIILLTDADEIVDRRALDGFWPHLASLRMATSKHFLNYAAMSGNTHATRRSGAICRGEHLARYGSTYLRTGLSTARKVWDSVPAAGWHFTSMGEAETVVQKFAAYAHQEDAKVAHRDLGAMSENLAQVRRGTYAAGWGRVDIDERFPRYVRENQDLLASMIL